MKINAAKLGIFAAGAAVGAVISAIITRNVVDKTYREVGRHRVHLTESEALPPFVSLVGYIIIVLIFLRCSFEHLQYSTLHFSRFEQNTGVRIRKDNKKY